MCGCVQFQGRLAAVWGTEKLPGGCVWLINSDEHRLLHRQAVVCCIMDREKMFHYGVLCPFCGTAYRLNLITMKKPTAWSDINFVFHKQHKAAADSNASGFGNLPVMLQGSRHFIRYSAAVLAFFRGTHPLSASVCRFAQTILDHIARIHQEEVTCNRHTARQLQHMFNHQPANSAQGLSLELIVKSLIITAGHQDHPPAETQVPKPETRDPRPETRDPKPQTQNPNPKTETRNRPRTPQPKP